MPPKINDEIESFLNASNNENLNKLRQQPPLMMVLVIKKIYVLIKKRILAYICKDVKYAYHRRNVLDKFWLILLINEYRHARKLQQHSIKLTPLLINNNLVPVDTGIAPVIYVLNELNCETSFSCEGHVTYIQGHKVISSTYICLSPRNVFPTSLKQYLIENKVSYRLKEPITNGLYKHGEALYAMQNNEELLLILNQWATNNNAPENLKKRWKK